MYIFGSRARNDYTDNSDIDVAVKLTKLDTDGSEYSTWFYENESLKKSLQDVLPYVLQLVWYGGDDTPVIKSGIKKSSIKVYELIDT